jgi:hypothetical protein
VDKTIAEINALRAILHDESPNKSQPVDLVIWVPIEQVEPNDYNPNSVATIEMQLLATSIEHDGYTQPVVAVQETACEITLPCGSILYIKESEIPQWVIWKTANLTLGSLDIQQGCWMEREVLDFSMEKIHRNAKAAIEFNYHNLLLTTGKTSANGLETNGAWDMSTMQLDCALSTHGMLQGIMTSSDCLEIVCPSCESKDKGHKKHWTSFQANQQSGVEYGLHVSCLSSEVKAQQQEQRTLRSDCREASMLLEQSETNLELTPLTGMGEPVLLITNKTTAIIVDGFHRYFVMKSNKTIRERCNGLLPVVVISKDINDRMASTIRHNRARGKHSVAGMANTVFQMLENGWDDAEICNELGMEPEEILRLKHITGFSKLFENTEYNKSWMTRRQIKIKKEYEERVKHG